MSSSSRPVDASPSVPPMQAPSFLSPEPAALTARDHMQRTLSEGARKKQQKRKLLDATPTILRRKKKLPIGDTPQAKRRDASVDSARGKENEPNGKNLLQASGADALEKPRKTKVEAPTGVETATRRLEFAATPSKPEKKAKKKDIVPESSSSSSDEEDDNAGHSSGSSDSECEVTFDAMTLGNLRIVREAVPSPLSTVSTASSAASKSIGTEYQFSLSSTVSSIAIAPDGKFLVAGFYNGTIYLYPLSQDSFRYRHGVMLDHISARGMYTQLTVRVSLPADGKFIFAGVYRGSTEIRAFEVDSIELPSLERLAQAASLRGTDDDDSDEDSDKEGASGVPSARSVSHTYSDAKLKGFSDVKSVVKKSNNKTEYQLLCGLGIKNIHLWRFYQDETAGEWAWECIFDKQNNGISIEMLCFHRDIDNQIISKSEHQNIRIWNLEEDVVSGELKKKSHVDVKQTVDAVAVYGDHAYGGGESLALIDLRSSSRMELDLPLSIKEQEAKRASARANAGNRITANMRGRRGGTRGRGSAEDAINGQRLMRMVSQVAGQDSAPFVVGMCTDGSVFLHRPQPDTMGLATPLEYVEGYEGYFQDPSLSFQAQFSDLTRVNTSGRLSVLPLPKTEKEEWIVVAANTKQLLVRSLDAFLHRNEQKQDRMRVKRGLRAALHQMGNNGPSSESDSDDDSSSDDEPIRRKPVPRASSDLPREGKDLKQVKTDRSKEDAAGEKTTGSVNSTPGIDRGVVSGAGALAQTAKAESLKQNSSEQIETPASATEVQEPCVDDLADTMRSFVSTPIRKERSLGVFTGRSTAAPSPVVSISSPSASSNPNTPERVKKLSDAERRSLVMKELEWTPQATGDNRTAHQHTDIELGEASAKDNSNSNNDTALPVKRNRPAKRKSGKARTKGVAQALFINDEAESNQTEEAPPAPKTSKRPAPVELEEAAPRKRLAVETEDSPAEPQVDEECTDVEDDCDMFSLTPLLSDGGSLLAAAIYQYSPHGASVESAPTRSFNPDEVQLMMRFSSQLERLKRSYNVDRERIMGQFTSSECDCGTKKKAPSTASKLNWRMQISSEASKKKHMKRRQKKLLASRLRDLQTSYEAKLSDIQIIQRLELQAFTARQEFLLLATQA